MNGIRKKGHPKRDYPEPKICKMCILLYVNLSFQVVSIYVYYIHRYSDEIQSWGLGDEDLPRDGK